MRAEPQAHRCAVGVVPLARPQAVALSSAGGAAALVKYQPLILDEVDRAVQEAQRQGANIADHVKQRLNTLTKRLVSDLLVTGNAALSQQAEHTL